MFLSAVASEPRTSVLCCHVTKDFTLVLPWFVDSICAGPFLLFMPYFMLNTVVDIPLIASESSLAPLLFKIPTVILVLVHLRSFIQWHDWHQLIDWSYLGSGPDLYLFCFRAGPEHWLSSWPWLNATKGQNWSAEDHRLPMAGRFPKLIAFDLECVPNFLTSLCH